MQDYRDSQDISDDWNAGIIVQAYVFGDVEPRSGAGVASSRERDTQRKILTGEWTPNRQGLFLMQGLVSPQNIDYLRGEIPDAFGELNKSARILDNYWGTRDGYFGTPQAIEFAISNGELWLTQAGIDHSGENQESFPPLKFQTNNVLEIAKGDVAYGSEGGLRGIVVFNLDDILKPETTDKIKDNPDIEAVIFVSRNPTPPDSPALINADRRLRKQFGKRLAIITETGGITSHASVIASQNQIPTIVHARGLTVRGVSPGVYKVKFLGEEAEQYDPYTLDFGTGRIFQGVIPVETRAQSLGEVETDITINDIDFVMDNLSGKPIPVILSLEEYLKLSNKVKDELKTHLIADRIKVMLTNVVDRAEIPEELNSILSQKSRVVKVIPGDLTQETLSSLKGFIGERDGVHFSKTLTTATPIEEAIGTFKDQFRFVKQKGDAAGTLTAAMLLASDAGIYQKFFKEDASGFWVLSDLYQLIEGLIQEFLGEQVLAQAA